MSHPEFNEWNPLDVFIKAPPLLFKPYAGVNVKLKYKLPFHLQILRRIGLRIQGDGRSKSNTLDGGEPGNARLYGEVKLLLYEQPFTRALRSVEVLRKLWVGKTHIEYENMPYTVHGEDFEGEVEQELTDRTVDIKIDLKGFFGRIDFGGLVGSIFGGISGIVLAEAAALTWVLSHVTPVSTKSKPRFRDFARLVVRNPGTALVSTVIAGLYGGFLGMGTGQIVGSGVGYSVVNPPSGVLHQRVTFTRDGKVILGLPSLFGTGWPDAESLTYVFFEGELYFLKATAFTLVRRDNWDDFFDWNAMLARGRMQRDFDEILFGKITNRDIVRRIANGEEVDLQPTDYEALPYELKALTND